MIPFFKVVVTPAKAGVQDLNGSRAVRATQKLIAGGSAPAPWVTLLCLSKEESPEERTSRSRRRPLALLAGIGARLNSPGAEQRATGSNTRLAIPDSGCDARRRLRVKNRSDSISLTRMLEWLAGSRIHQNLISTTSFEHDNEVLEITTSPF